MDSKEAAKKLFSIAINSIEILDSSPTLKLSPKGLCEAAILNTIFITNSPQIRALSNYEQILDAYFVRLYYMVEQQYTGSDDLCDFINKRLNFYQEELRKTTNNKEYAPMFLYTTLYQTPLEETPSFCYDATKILICYSNIVNMAIDINVEVSDLKIL